MKRYSSLCAFDNEVVECFEKVNCDFDESVTDDSFYVPESELIKRLRNGVTYGQALQGAYDFADGKDTGAAVPIDRYPGIDRAEVSEFVRAKESEARENFNKDMESAAKKTAEKAAAEKAAAEKAAAEKAAAEKAAAETTEN